MSVAPRWLHVAIQVEDVEPVDAVDVRMTATCLLSGVQLTQSIATVEVVVTRLQVASRPGRTTTTVADMQLAVERKNATRVPSGENPGSLSVSGRRRGAGCRR